MRITLPLSGACALGFLLVASTFVLGPDYAQGSLAFVVGHRHASLHRVSLWALNAVIPLAVLGAVMQAYRLKRLRDDANLERNLIDGDAIAFMISPLLIFASLSWILDGALVTTCTLLPPIDSASARATAAADVFAGFIGLLLGAFLTRQKHFKLLMPLSKLILVVSVIAITAFISSTVAKWFWLNTLVI